MKSSKEKASGLTGRTNRKWTRTFAKRDEDKKYGSDKPRIVLEYFAKALC